MPITRKLVAQDENDVNQWLKVDSSSRFIVNDTPEWQFLFGPNSTPSESVQLLKLAAQFDTDTFEKIRLIGYIFNPLSGTVDSSTPVEFKIYRVQDIGAPRWDDAFITSIFGSLQANNYYFAEIDISSLTGASLDGDSTLMIEASAKRLNTTYRDRIYVNHLGVYYSVVQLRQSVEYLDVTKQDE